MSEIAENDDEAEKAQTSRTAPDQLPQGHVTLLIYLAN